MLPFASTMTAPTQGLGEDNPTPWRARSSALCRNCSSVEWLGILYGHQRESTTETRSHGKIRVNATTPTTRVAGRRQLDCPPPVLRVRPHQILLLAPFRAAQERTKTGPRRDQLALAGE